MGDTMPTLTQRLRQQPTAAEVRFWRLIYPVRSKWRFRRQVLLHTFVVDFASHTARLVVEIDGDTHYVGDGQMRDARRDAILAARGFEVLRFTNDEVMHNPEGVYHRLLAVLAQRSPPP
jgi:very-short-patch-repair endonuclease